MMRPPPHLGRLALQEQSLLLEVLLELLPLLRPRLLVRFLLVRLVLVLGSGFHSVSRVLDSFSQLSINLNLNSRGATAL